jgi:hypothetical protein
MKELSKAHPSWRIFRPQGANEIFMGIVRAVDRQRALEKAIDEFKVTDPEQQKRLLVKVRD